jgi:hypothetical protein
MAFLALDAEHTGMVRRLTVTAGAVLGYAGKYEIGVTGGASQASMLASQGEKCGVVEIRETVNPIVAGQAVGPKFTLVPGGKFRLTAAVALNTAFRTYLVDQTQVTACTFDRGVVKILFMLDQAKGHLLMVKGRSIKEGREPACRGMAGCTVLPKHIDMGGGFGMAGLTLAWGTFENTVGVALHAIHAGVLAL